jgi:TetR/AcrR family transcriptional regulator, transcriptional repressor for nem operon
VPRDAAATRLRILDAAEKLVIDNGYAATSVDQVIAESGTSKGAFFHHFSSKRDLARHLVDRYAANDVAQLHEGLAGVAGVVDPGERLVAFLRWFEESADEIMAAQSNCLYVSVLTERQLASDDTSDQIRKAVVAWREELAALVREIPAGRLPDGIDPEALADHVFVTFEGAFILCRSMADPSYMRAQLRVLRRLLEGLLAPGR